MRAPRPVKKSYIKRWKIILCVATISQEEFVITLNAIISRLNTIVNNNYGTFWLSESHMRSCHLIPTVRIDEKHLFCYFTAHRYTKKYAKISLMLFFRIFIPKIALGVFSNQNTLRIAFLEYAIITIQMPEKFQQIGFSMSEIHSCKIIKCIC